jgi:hypothetical protein
VTPVEKGACGHVELRIRKSEAVDEFVQGGGAARCPNFVASIATFGSTSVSSNVSTPDSQVTVRWTR